MEARQEAYESRNTIQRVEKAIKAYLASCKANGLSAGTIANYERITKKYMDFIKENEYEDASIASVNDWKISLSEAGVKITTMNLYMGILKSFFDWAVQMEMIDKSPVIPVVMPSKKAVNVEKKKPYTKLLTANEFKAILSCGRPKGVTEIKWKRNRAILVTFLTSGLRNSELRDLKMKDISFEKGTITVENGKGGKSRICAFPKIAQDAMRDYLESGYRPNNLGENDFVFGTNEDGWKQFDRFTLSQLVQRNIKLITGRDDCRSHSLRHASASWMLLNGINMDNISSLLGHASVATTALYAERLNPSSPSEEANNMFDSLNAF
jgi:site-specific recombinase XerD